MVGFLSAPHSQTYSSTTYTLKSTLPCSERLDGIPLPNCGVALICIPRVAHRIHMMKARVARMLPFRTDSLSFRPSGEARVLNVEPVDLLLPEQRKCRKSIGNCLLKRWFLRIKHIVPNHEKVSKTLALIQGKSHKHKGRAHRGKKCPGPWSKSNSNGTSPHKILHW